MIADDSPTLRRIVGMVLEREGFTVVPAEDGVEAVQAVFAHQPDCVILDVQMPRVSGYVAARVLKDDWQTADIPVLLLTSLDAASDRYWGEHVGADRFLTKDFEAPDLVKTVRGLIVAERREPWRPRAAHPDTVELTDDDVFGRVCDLLDRKLFEAQVAAEMTGIAGHVQGFEETVAAVLGVLGKIVDYDLASVLMLDDRTTYLTVARETSHAQYGEFFAGGRRHGVPGHRPGHRDARPAGAGRRRPRVPRRRGRGRRWPPSCRCRCVLAAAWSACWALSSAVKNAFGETSLNTLRLVEAPAAVVIDNARLSGYQPA